LYHATNISSYLQVLPSCVVYINVEWQFSIHLVVFNKFLPFFFFILLSYSKKKNLQDAIVTVAWARSYLSGEHAPGILVDENPPGNGDSVGSPPSSFEIHRLLVKYYHVCILILLKSGFKGIFVRYCCQYAKRQNDVSTLQWLQLNAAHAWSMRSNSSIVWTQWCVSSNVMLLSSMTGFYHHERFMI
jgi:hypothetical protein